MFKHSFGSPPHGVHVREGVGGGDLSEEIGIVGNGREKVHCLHQGQIVGHLVHRRVVALVKAHQQIGVLVDPNPVQQLGQHSRPHFGAASGALGKFGQFHFIFHTRHLSK